MIGYHGIRLHRIIHTINFPPTVVMQRFEVGVTDAAGEVGGPAVFTCDVPPTVASYVTVTSWSVDGRTIRPGSRPGV